MNLLKKLNFLKLNVTPMDNIDRRLVLTSNVFVALIILLSIFCVINLLQQSYSLAKLTFISLLPSLLGLYLLKNNYNIKRLRKFLTIGIFIFLLAVLYIREGIEYTLMWSLTFAFIAMLLNGYKKGLYYSIVFYTINFIFVYTLIGDTIAQTAYIRFVAVCIISIAGAFYYEYITYHSTKMLFKSINKINKINKNLEKTIKKELEKNLEKESIIFEKSKLASMGEMIGNIAHQWRQPLSVISVGATGLKMQKEYKILTDDFFYQTCNDINNNAQYLSKTIEDFRSFIKGNKEDSLFNLNKIIKSFLLLVNSTIKTHNINIIFEKEKEIQINGHSNELIQCLINIFNNSKDAFINNREKNKYFFINIEEKNNNVLVKLKDNAGGIDENIISKVFEPYFTTKHKSKGTGIGLNMSYNLITLGMGGDIKAKNISYKFKDKDYYGAEFTIFLPINKNK